MLETHVSVIIWHEDMETLEITMQEVREIIEYMTNRKRRFQGNVGRTAGTDENGNNVNFLNPDYWEKDME